MVPDCIKTDILKKASGTFIHKGLMRIEGEVDSQNNGETFIVNSENYTSEEEFMKEVSLTVDKIYGAIAYKSII